MSQYEDRRDMSEMDRIDDHFLLREQINKLTQELADAQSVQQSLAEQQGKTARRAEELLYERDAALAMDAQNRAKARASWQSQQDIIVELARTKDRQLARLVTLTPDIYVSEQPTEEKPFPETWKMRAQKLHNGAVKQENEIQQILGKALGYPNIKDDPQNFPDANDDYIVGPNTAMSLIDEIAERYSKSEQENAGLRETIRTRLLAEEERTKLTGDALIAESELNAALALVEEGRTLLSQYAENEGRWSLLLNDTKRYLAKPLPESLQAAGERVRRMEAALREYADESNWERIRAPYKIIWGGGSNGGGLARAALAEATATDEQGEG